MNYLTRMDLALGALMDNVFRLGRGFQPADIARLLRRSAVAKERKTLTASFVPNLYLVGLAEEDHQRMEPIEHEIITDLTQALQVFVSRQGLMTLGPLKVTMHPEERLGRGRVRLKAVFEQEEG